MLSWIWPILLAIYIISPFDAHPLFLDDFIASGVLFYLLNKNSKKKKQQQHQYYEYYDQSQSSEQTEDTKGEKENGSNGSPSDLTLDDAYRILGISPCASSAEIRSAYKQKLSRTHPDKVSHLSDKLVDRAKELTLELNAARDLIKQYKDI